MKKFACILAALTLFGAVAPAQAQYFFADSGGVVVGVNSYAASPRWGGPGYAFSSRLADPGYAYSSGWGGPGSAYALAPASEAYASVPACRLSNCVATCPTAKWSFAELACAECRAKLTKRSEIGDERMGSPCDRMRSELFGYCRESARADAAVAEARSEVPAAKPNARNSRINGVPLI